MVPAPRATPVPTGRPPGWSNDLPDTPNRQVQEALIGDSLPLRNRPFIASSSPAQRRDAHRQTMHNGTTNFSLSDNPFAILADIAEEEPTAGSLSIAEAAIAKAQDQLDVRASILRAYSQAISQCARQFSSGYGKKFAAQLTETLLQCWQNSSPCLKTTQNTNTAQNATARSAVPERAVSFATIAEKAASHQPGNERLARPRPTRVPPKTDSRVMIRLQEGSSFFEKGLQIQLAIKDKLQLPLRDIPEIKQTNTGWALNARTVEIQENIIQKQQLWGPLVDLAVAEKQIEWHSYLIKNFPTAITSWDGSTLDFEETVLTAVKEQTGLQPVHWRQSNSTTQSDSTTTLIIAFNQPLKSRFRLLGLGDLSIKLTKSRTINQCQNCWSYHPPSACRTAQRCENCGSMAHQKDNCTAASRCINCHGAHSATYKRCFAQPKKTENGLRSLSKTELAHARKQGSADPLHKKTPSRTDARASAAAKHKDNLNKTQQNASPSTNDTLDLPMIDATEAAQTITTEDIVHIDSDSDTETDEETIEEEIVIPTPVPLPDYAETAHTPAARPTKPASQLLNSQRIKAKYRQNVQPEPTEIPSEPITRESARTAARQRSPPSSPPARERSPMKTRRIQAPTSYARK